MLLNTAIIGKFNKLSVICKPGSIHGCKSNFILTLLLKRALISNISSPESKARPSYQESIKYSFLKLYGKIKMCFTCATYTDLSFLIPDEILRVTKLIHMKMSKQVTEMVHEL